MSTYAGADIFPDELELPDDGTVKDAMSVNVPFEGLADRTVYNKGRGDELDALTRALVALNWWPAGVYVATPSNASCNGLHWLTTARGGVANAVDLSFDGGETYVS